MDHFILDRQQLWEQIDNDQELLAETLAMLQEDSRELLASIREAIAVGNSKHLQESAHALKGALGNFCALESAETAQRLETLADDDDFLQAERVGKELELQIEELKAALEQMI